jgi:hypothetical protein
MSLHAHLKTDDRSPVAVVTRNRKTLRVFEDLSNSVDLDFRVAVQVPIHSGRECAIAVGDKVSSPCAARGDAGMAGTAKQQGFVTSGKFDGSGTASGQKIFFRTNVSGFLFCGNEEGARHIPSPGQEVWNILHHLAQRISSEKASLLLHLGDIAYYNGEFEHLHSAYLDEYSLMARTPFFPTPGNHDYLTGNAAPYLATHSVPSTCVPLEDCGRYYSFDWSNVHFVSLDSNQPLESCGAGTGKMLQWLENDLQATRQFWKVVFFHHPPYAFGPNQNDSLCALSRELIVPILERYGVQAVFSGHEHSYQRTLPLSGGGFLYPVYSSSLLPNGASEYHYMRVEADGLRMTFHVVRADGSEIETHTIQPPPVLAASEGSSSIWLMPAGAAGEAFVRISGSGLAPAEMYATDDTGVLEKVGTQVTVNDQPVSLSYVSPNQIYGYVQCDLEGSVSVRVETQNGVAEDSISMGGDSSLSVRQAAMAMKGN